MTYCVITMVLTDILGKLQDISTKR